MGIWRAAYKARAPEKTQLMCTNMTLETFMFALTLLCSGSNTRAILLSPGSEMGAEEDKW